MIALNYLLLKNIKNIKNMNKDNKKKETSIIEPNQKIEYDVVNT